MSHLGGHDEFLLSVPSSGFGEDVQFQPIRVEINIIFTSFLVIALDVYVLIKQGLFNRGTDSGYEVKIGILLIVANWAIFFLQDIFLFLAHRTSRYRGYLSFYRDSQTIRKMPFLLLSVMNSLLLVGYVLFDDEKQHKTMIQIVCSVNVALVGCCYFIYLRKILRFNWEMPSPDVYQRMSDDQIGGAINVDDNMEMMEKQADMIRYIRQQNQNLKVRVGELSERLDQFEKGSGASSWSTGKQDGCNIS